MGAKKRELKPKIAPKSAGNSAPTIKGEEAATIFSSPETVAAGMHVELWSIHKVRPYGKNPRKISNKAIQKVANSLKAFGWRQPLVVDAKGVLIVGHTRYEAAKTLDMVSVPVHVASDLDATRIRAYRLADNKTGEISKWQEDLLSEELAALDMEGVDMGAWGFSKDSIDDIIEDMAKADAEAAESAGESGGHIKCPECGHQWPKEGKA